MSRKKLLINLIEAVEKPEFDKIVKTYLKELYNYKRIVNTDGPNDTGIDIKVFDTDAKRMQYQLTTQKSKTETEKKAFTKKLKEDLTKAKENSDEFGYTNNLFYFYSWPLSNKTIREYERLALKDFEINLELIEANRIAEESEEYHELQRVVLKLGDIDKINIKESIFSNPEENLIFDLLSFGKPSEIKYHIIESVIFQSLFEKKELSKEDIIQICKSKFSTDEQDVFYDKLIHKFLSEKRITKVQHKDLYKLTDEEENRIQSLIKKYNLDEEIFIIKVSEILSKWNQESFIEDYINKLKQLYIDNFHSDVFDVIVNSVTTDLTGLSREFQNFVIKKLGDKKGSKELIKELLIYCQEDKFMQKFCASKVFTEKTNLNRLEDYVNAKKRIFLDTQIALYALCYFYNPDCNLQNYYFTTTKGLLEFAKTNSISLYISERYIWEAQNHLREALNLIPFTNLPNFNRLGKSRNVIFNFYVYLNEACQLTDLTYQEFLEEFGFSQYDSYKVHNSNIEYYLSELGINKIEIEKEYDIDEVEKIIVSELVASNKFKTKFSLANDAIMLEFLADNDPNIHLLQPVFSSWDKTLFKVREKYFEKFQSAQRWFMFTPGKLIDHYAILNFSIDSETVTRDILAIISDEIIGTTHSLLDSISIILNPEDEIGLEYTNRFAKMRDQEIHQIKTNQIFPPEELEGEAVIDDVFYKLTNHYLEAENELKFFKQVFTKKEFIDKVFYTLDHEIKHFYSHKKISDNLFIEFNSMISILKDEEKQRITRTVL
ncbi:MAG: hypothetical protein JXB49_21985 [Bacteroidales bacterium]|nr:hypothetical protein [Bacteroidales bacterium]